MTDPWINLRGQAGEQVELIHTPECDTETNPIWEDPQCTCEAYSFNRLLADADALLAVARARMRQAIRIYGEPPDEHFEAFLHGAYPDIAALPKHLKQEEI